MVEQNTIKKSRKIPLSWIINAIFFVIILLCLICFFADHQIQIIKKNHSSADKIQVVSEKKSVHEALVTTKVKVRVNGQEVSNTKSVAKVRLDGKSKPVIIPNQNQKLVKVQKVLDNVEVVDDNFYAPKQNTCFHKNQIKSNLLSGDVIISRKVTNRLSESDVINGNLYLEDMYSYKLPCDIKVNGNLFVRNVRQLKFCGRLLVNGNIYVSKGSAFGVLPKGSKIQGQIIM